MARRRQRLAKRRQAVGLTQEALAEGLGVDRSTIVRWEAGTASPQAWMRPSLAAAIHITIEELASLLAGRTEQVEPRDILEQEPPTWLRQSRPLRLGFPMRSTRSPFHTTLPPPRASSPKPANNPAEPRSRCNGRVTGACDRSGKVGSQIASGNGSTCSRPSLRTTSVQP